MPYQKSLAEFAARRRQTASLLSQKGFALLGQSHDTPPGVSCSFILTLFYIQNN